MYQPGAADYQDLIPAARARVRIWVRRYGGNSSFLSLACSQSRRVMFQALQSYPHFPQDYTAVASRDNAHPMAGRQS